MPTPEQLEAAADRLRDCASKGRAKAQALATHIDALVTTGKDDTVWKGTYPDQAASTMQTDQTGLGRAAALLREDAAAWGRKAHELDDQAADLRAEAKRKAAAAAEAAEPDKAGAPR